MHDRRVDGKTLKFGNQGALFMSAMTWWDHGTQSIWSQPWGSAIDGPLSGTALTLIPAAVVPWATWLKQHPKTTVVANGLDQGRGGITRVQDDFVIGVALKDLATAYDFSLAASEQVINDRIGQYPVVVFVDAKARGIEVYLRRPVLPSQDIPGPSELVFKLDEGSRAVDVETRSVWDITRGVAVEGPLRGAILQQIPWVSSFDWAWRDFFPHTTFYEG